MAFLARCPMCSRPQRVDVLRDIELHEAGDVFVRCNDWSNCGEMFIASAYAGHTRDVNFVWTWQVPPFESAGYKIGTYYSAINQAVAMKRKLDRFEQLVSFTLSPGDSVAVLTPAQQRDLHLG